MSSIQDLSAPRPGAGRTTDGAGVVAAAEPPRTSFGLYELPSKLSKPREVNMLAGIEGLPGLPSADEVRNSTLNLDDIQNDIMVGMQKNIEQFLFFTIKDPQKFKTVLHDAFFPKSDGTEPLITSVLRMLDPGTQPQVAINLAFSQTGLNDLGITDDLEDTPFKKSQSAGADELGDPGTKNWKPAFKDPKSLHGVFILASDDQKLIEKQVSTLHAWFGESMSIVYQLDAAARKGENKGHEMFGFLDGISQPEIYGFKQNGPLPGQAVVSPGVILVGHEGDSLRETRPRWALNGSFLAFRELQQLVPEWTRWITKTAQELGIGPDLFGARLMGRWKSGAPVQLAPRIDDPGLGCDPYRNNDFDYKLTGSDFQADQSRCPFHAHIRKMRPRADMAPDMQRHAIMRAGIPYGDDPTPEEMNSGTSDPNNERGFAFVSYQSQLSEGFIFVQRKWANVPEFVRGKKVAPGYDPIIGANGKDETRDRYITGAKIKNPAEKLDIKEEFVVSRGGEYFFSPSLSALRDVISKV